MYYNMYFSKKKLEYIFAFIILFFSFFVNFYSGRVGIHPIDSFSFFDSAYNILNGKHPVKDYWAFSGIVIDYFQAFFFKIFVRCFYVLFSYHMCMTCVLKLYESGMYYLSMIFLIFVCTIFVLCLCDASMYYCESYLYVF